MYYFSKIRFKKLSLLLFILSSIIFISCLSYNAKKIDQKNDSISQVFIKTINGKNLVFDVNKNENIKDLKNKIKDKLGYKIESQSLNYKNKIYKDEILLKEFPKHTTFTLSSKLNGGNNFFKFVDLNKTNSIIKNFNPNAPKWRTIFPGINIEAVCSNKDCIVKRCWAIIKNRKGKLKKRFKGSYDKNYKEDFEDQFENGCFNLYTLFNSLHCPKCDSKCEEVKNIGFYKCEFSIYAKEYATRKSIKNTSNIASNENLTTFKEFEIKDYSFVQIIVESRKL
ncbi:MAG: hypothetical protein GY830_01940 [Bacteroidetes bacterium]|nr:hypothetical protein [Bacteroidota bacterium]